MPSVILWAKFMGAALAVNKEHAEARERDRARSQEGEEEGGEEATWPSPSKTCPSMTAYVCVLHRKYIFQGLVSWWIYASALLSANPTLHPSTHPPRWKGGRDTGRSTCVTSQVARV